jgi:fumarate reductase subunit C
MEAVFELVLAGTGLALAGFMILHEGMLSSVWLGAASMDRLAAALERGGFVGAGVAVVAVLLLLHAVAAVRRVPLRAGEVRALVRTATGLRHWDTISWGIQLATALCIGFYAAIHVWVAGRDLPVEAAKSVARVRDLARTGFYDCLLFAVAVHTALGLERMATKWGFPGRLSARALSWGLFAFLMVAGFGTLIVFHRLARGG